MKVSIRLFRHKDHIFHVRNAPSSPTIYRLVQRFLQQGTVCDLPRAGRPRAVRNDVNIARVQASIEENPETSTRRRSQQLARGREQNFLRPEVENNPELWFQQDGATAHTARPTMALLREIFGDRIIISRFSDFNWPPRSPDLTAPDFFLWGYLKGKVYANKPRTIQQLKANIREEVRALGPEILRKVMENALERARQVEANNGHHLKDIIFKT